MVEQKQRKKATIHQLTTMLSIAKNVLFRGHNHLLTTCADGPTLWLSPERQQLITSLIVYFWIQYNLDKSTTHPKFDPTGIQTHDLQIMTVHFMSLRRLL